jgi:pilus assembly protein Flp/PilA
MLDLISTAVMQLRLRHREDGQAMVEYALILALVSIAAIAVLKLIGTDVTAVFTSVDQALQGA